MRVSMDMINGMTSLTFKENEELEDSSLEASVVGEKDDIEGTVPLDVLIKKTAESSNNNKEENDDGDNDDDTISLLGAELDEQNEEVISHNIRSSKNTAVVDKPPNPIKAIFLATFIIVVSLVAFNLWMEQLDQKLRTNFGIDPHNAGATTKQQQRPPSPRRLGGLGNILEENGAVTHH